MQLLSGLRAFRAGRPVTTRLLMLGVCAASVVAVTAPTTAADVTPAISIRMTATPEQFTATRQAVTYTYYVANTGSETLDPVTVTDQRPGLTGPACTATMLVPETSLTCVARYVTTPADVAHGRATGFATVTGLTPQGVLLRAAAEVSIPLAGYPAISIEKSADVARFSAAGQEVTYRYRVRNSSNVPLHGVTVTDSKAGPASCPAGALAPGASMTCTASYTTTAADEAARHVTNTGTVTGRTPGGVPVRAQSSLTLPFTAVHPVRPVPPPPAVRVPVPVTG